MFSVPKFHCKCIANNMSFNSTLTIWMPPSCELSVTWLKLLGLKLLWSPKNESALAGTSRLVKDRSRKSGSIPERSVTKLASGTTHSCCWHTWSTSTPLCQHQSPGSTSFQTFHRRRSSFSGCHLTDLELTARHSRFGINTTVVPCSTSWKLSYLNYPLFISPVLVVSQ